MPALRYKLTISYDGTEYSGWQIQPNATTVQEVVEQSLSKVLNRQIRVVGCGRTDAGVHASCYVLHFDYPGEIESKLLFKMNQVLPPSVAVLDLELVEFDFHARFDASSRTYHYLVHFQKDPFKYMKSTFLFQAVDMAQMNECAALLLDYDDFASFCKAGADNKTTLCNIYEADWTQIGDQMKFVIKADRFLRNMVRAIVGTMLDVGSGKITVAEFKAIIEAKDRSKSGKSAAACGLYLAGVEY